LTITEEISLTMITLLRPVMIMAVVETRIARIITTMVIAKIMIGGR
jgi:hypothetical protein